MNSEGEYDDSDLVACSCGGRAILHAPAGKDDPWWWARCSLCGLRTEARSQDFRAVEDWNALHDDGKSRENSDLKIAPATIVDLADMAEQVRASRMQWGIIRQATAEGQSWSLRHGDALLGVAGLVPIGPGQAEAWFHFRPEAAGSMRAIVRAIRLTMDASPYRAIVTLCTSEAGKRIARVAGFTFAEHSGFGEVWAYGRASGQFDRRSRRESEGAGAEPAADDAGAAGGTAG